MLKPIALCLQLKVLTVKTHPLFPSSALVPTHTDAETVSFDHLPPPNIMVISRR